MEYVSIKSRVLASLRRTKRGMTAQELTTKLDLTNMNSVYAVVSVLRKEGHDIVATPNRNGVNRYSIPA